MIYRQTLPDMDFSEWTVTVPEYQNMCVQKYTQYKEHSGLNRSPMVLERFVVITYLQNSFNTEV